MSKNGYRETQGKIRQVEQSYTRKYGSELPQIYASATREKWEAREIRMRYILDCERRLDALEAVSAEPASVEPEGERDVFAGALRDAFSRPSESSVIAGNLRRLLYVDDARVFRELGENNFCGHGFVPIKTRALDGQRS